MVTAAGPVEVKAPRVNDRRVDEASRWCSSWSSPPGHDGAITGAHLVSLVRAGARSENGVLVERSEVAA